MLSPKSQIQETKISRSLHNLSIIEEEKVQCIRIIISDLEGKSKIYTVNININGTDLYSLAGITKANYKDFRLIIGFREIYPTS